MNGGPTEERTGGPAGVSGGRMVLTLGVVGLIASVLLVGTYQLTLPRIEANRAAFLEAAIFDVLPGATTKTTYVREGDRLVPLRDETQPGLRVHAGYDEAGALVGVAVPAQGPGFADVVRILYGYDPACECVVGMRVLDSRETPGLGDKVETDPGYVGAFRALDVRLGEDGLLNPVTPVKAGAKTEPWQVETITGATVTSKAIVDIIDASAADVLPLVRDHLDLLRARAAEPGRPGDPALVPSPQPPLPPLPADGDRRRRAQSLP